MKEELVSIIMPVYQVAEFLPQCLDSILAQTYRNWELILVDDGSKDGSGGICEEYAKKDSRIRVLHTENAGAAAARNRGLAMASAEYIMFADGDDYLWENMVERMLTTIQDSPYDLVVSNFLRVFPEERENFPSQLSDLETTGREVLARWKNSKNYGVWTVVWNKIVRRSVLEGLRFPEGKYFEDEIFSDLLLLKCDRIRAIPDVLYANRVRRSSTMNTQKTRNYLDLIDAFRMRIQLYLENDLPVEEVFKILVFLLEPYCQCASAQLSETDSQRLKQDRAFIRQTAMSLGRMELSVLKKCALPAIALAPSLTFRAAIRFRGLLEKFL